MLSKCFGAKGIQGQGARGEGMFELRELSLGYSNGTVEYIMRIKHNNQT